MPKAGGIDPWELVKVLNGVAKYPIKRSELVRRAQKMNVSETIVNFFEAIPTPEVQDHRDIIGQVL